MGLFSRKKRTPSGTTAKDPWQAMERPISSDGALLEQLLDAETQDGPLDLREWVSAMFTADFFSATHVLNAANISADEWWFEHSNLNEQYGDSDREVREEALRTAMRFNNALELATYDDTRALTMHATVRMKALSLAIANDADYGTTHCHQIAADPQSFGVHQFGAGAP